MLSIIETLKEFRTILLGRWLKIYTNNKNLTCQNFNTDQLFQQRLIIEEYGPYIEYILGEKYISGDALLRLPNRGNKQTTHKSAFTMETMLELYDIKEITDDTSPLSFDIIY